MLREWEGEQPENNRVREKVLKGWEGSDERQYKFLTIFCTGHTDQTFPVRAKESIILKM